MINSGLTGISTVSDVPVTLISNPLNLQSQRITVTNTGGVAGFVSPDGGVTWVYLPAATAAAPGAIELWHPMKGDIQLKRFAGGSNVTGVYATGQNFT